MCLDNTTSAIRTAAMAGKNATRRTASRLLPGLCEETCFNFIPYVVVMCLAKLFLGIPISGVVMMQFR